MWRLGTVGVTLIALAAAIHAVAMKDAFACSVGEDFDPVAASEVIVEGRFLGYEVLSEDSPSGGFVAVRVDMAVTRVFKGEVSGASIVLIDDRTLTINPTTGAELWGGGGSCGAFSEDPTGKYAIMGLQARLDGTYGPSLPLWFFAGEGPGDERYARALERIASFPGAAHLPSLGSGPASSPTRISHATLPAAALTGLALLLLGLGLRIRSRGNS